MKGSDIRAAREALGLSRERLAFLAGISASTLYNAEQGAHKPHPLIYRAITETLQKLQAETELKTAV
jgi:transcriptional regulator with XRE-family HTH domain